MLHWLAGRQTEHDPDDVEAPETPAPVFAVRAFKHAIFGTPATVASRQRRNSNVEQETARTTARPIRPTLSRPKSANDAATMGRMDELSASPTKGILLTPGTVSGRAKTVTFDGHVVDKGTARDWNNGISDHTAKRHAASQHSNTDPMNEKTKCCQIDKRSSAVTISETKEEPTCTVGVYWKHEYDIYRENTSRELRKLLTKQKAAKGFAREKDAQCKALSEELQQERKKVDRLEQRAVELEMKMKELQAELLTSRYGGGENQAGSTARRDRSAQVEETLGSSIEAAQLLTSEALADLNLNSIRDRRANATQQTKTGQPPSRSRPQFKSRHDSLDPCEAVAPSKDTAVELRSELDLSAASFDEMPQGSSTPGNLGHIGNKENLSLAEEAQSQAADDCAVSSTDDQKHIVSRHGAVIPPDRVAAARARLAARRQQRITSGEAKA